MTSHKDFKHLNSNLLCSVSIVTTGNNPELHDILSVCILPLDVHLKPSPQLRPLYLRLKPRFPENAKPPSGLLNGFSHYIETGSDYFASAQLFDYWFENLGLKHNKGIEPLGHQFGLVRAFLIDWLGDVNYSCCFSEQVRDVTAVALAKNDAAATRIEHCPYPKHHLSYYLSQLNLPPVTIRDALEFAKVYPTIYLEMLRT